MTGTFAKGEVTAGDAFVVPFTTVGTGIVAHS